MSASSSTQALEYLEGLPLATHKKLYEQPSTVLAVFRCMLPHLAKSIVMAMLYMPSPFPAADLDAWFKPSARKEKERATFTLDRLHIITSSRQDNGTLSWTLSPGFQRSLRNAIEGSGTHRSFGVPATKEESGKRVSVEFLDEYSRAQWEGILYYLVSGAAGLGKDNISRAEVSPSTKTLLNTGDLVRTIHGSPRITKDGFSFVLQETNAQVWSLLIIYLKVTNELGMSETEVLAFLFMLGSLELGQDYSTSTLSPTQLRMLDDLSSMGLIYRSDKNARTFYPTRLATTLTSDSGSAMSASSNDIAQAGQGNAGPSATANKGFIIIETNYRLYAYTNSLIQIAILSLFTKLQHRFPNLVSGKLTKESVHKAVQSGITSAQIISYLTTYAHPQMQKTVPYIPPTVMDQIRLWEYEGERVETTPGYLMREFSSDAEYRDVMGYASALGVLVWQNDGARCFFVSQVEQISAYLKKKKENRESARGR
ncbi:TFB2 RNA polymerase II transcription initiation nucleotide excision repair factor TFIIH subunit TFB2 [Pyrenophora tritici-repentis]|uniref:RNA polymerase II transcription factor B subunit 2 n=2 Tax=Pyrenophora tritici-repentis TaxID=45151 RepID=A0A2W1GDR5_9PLEO|nr:RNA polymerase II transcription factor B subunit 2 [Pyrenophora tritici-repentis Pt-1C-BFP]KAA8615513.1 RNA polymerase II transcription factor B subunit 2 [Pyrenophora tritici-repentis]EDU51456.1 RNA polymerase II transcription factor B subunit 2 [Pyrenophora tritici-repentis Pt-1C-BFP]KAF7443910.1 RNA polymerase II transcription factor B protein [Pyrenophora tritici-repentis]KAF7566369.1 TFB2, RNA polymerase II factor [Pyrenophora tritici-repentis]KAG9379647.1 RNA polymerase II transcripti